MVSSKQVQEYDLKRPKCNSNLQIRLQCDPMLGNMSKNTQKVLKRWNVNNLCKMTEIGVQLQYVVIVFTTLREYGKYPRVGKIFPLTRIFFLLSKDEGHIYQDHVTLTNLSISNQATVTKFGQQLHLLQRRPQSTRSLSNTCTPLVIKVGRQV